MERLSLPRLPQVLYTFIACLRTSVLRLFIFCTSTSDPEFGQLWAKIYCKSRPREEREEQGGILCL